MEKQKKQLPRRNLAHLQVHFKKKHKRVQNTAELQKIPLGNKITVNNKITNKLKQMPLGNKFTMSEPRPIRNFPKTKYHLKNKKVQRHNKTHKNAFHTPNYKFQ